MLEISSKDSINNCIASNICKSTLSGGTYTKIKKLISIILKFFNNLFTFVSSSPKIGIPFFLKSCSWLTEFPFMRFFINMINKPIGCSSSFSSKN